MTKENINLPKTSFSMKANLPKKEPEILKIWEKLSLYKKLRESGKGKEKFVLHDGPPYANGHIHMGTALNKILKDIITKFHQMDGKDSVYVPGWDCHGLPIEWKIEEQYKKNKKNKDQVPIKDFRLECREFAQKWIKIHIEEFKRLGVEGDWENYYSTMSYNAEAQIVRELGKFIIDETLYQGYKPVLWSTVEKTALADAEVEYKDHTSNTIYTSFEVNKTQNDFLKGAYIIIWTTTPWTIPVNRALVYNKKIKYSVLEIGQDTEHFKNKKIVVASNLINKVSEECNFKDFKILKEFNGSEFKDTICSHPLKDIGNDYDVPMLEGSFVTLEQGTGIVHAAPSHGPDDFNLCLKHGIKATNTINDGGLYSDEVPFFSGTHIFKADEKVIEKLSEYKSLLSNSKLQHSFPHSWRSKAPLIYRATSQWFISMEKKDLRKKALKAIDETIFYPDKGRDRIRSMVETRPDWCISRQRIWGVPLPLFVSKKTKEVLKDPEVIENIAKIYEKEGSDCWFTDDAQKFLGKKYNKDDYIKSTDIVEVWFDSGSTHSYVLEKRKDLMWPASMYLEGSDQHRGWFHSSLLESCGTRGKAPFKSILTHGFVVDGKGLKMSKSTGNVIAPEEVLKKYGADILRTWVAASDYSEDLKLDHSILEQHAESYRKIRNTFRFLLGNLNDKKNNLTLDSKEINEWPELEKFMLHKVFLLNKNYEMYFKEYNFHKLYKELVNFCSLELSAFYFDIRKDTLYCDSISSTKRKACINLLGLILDMLLKWFAPILSFTTEEIFQIINTDKKSSIHLQTFPKIPKNWKNDKLNEKWESFKKIKKVVNAAIEVKRTNKEIGSSLETDVQVYLDDNYLKIVKDLNLSENFITSKAEVKKLNNKDDFFKLDDIENVKVFVKKADGEKCPRCWKIFLGPCQRCESAN
ncbi:MAG: isoleucine--tRNA ligase [Candidatus Pelagibacter sp. TMED64]|nr:isoleucine--tRNA ligase [Candidatus Pelagibacter sp.]OUU64090.1 MAG: isoleucine--tRNA ligase [Candidatus Pelagibacter sp. TMED64]|tara:strand:+ start:1000 stop:3759 length:2760 start_codon:yes stop_codon:yes gene_type:complete